MKVSLPYGAQALVADLGDRAVATEVQGLQLKGVAEPVTAYVIESMAEESHE